MEKRLNKQQMNELKEKFREIENKSFKNIKVIFDGLKSDMDLRVKLELEIERLTKVNKQLEHKIEVLDLVVDSRDGTIKDLKEKLKEVRNRK